MMMQAFVNSLLALTWCVFLLAGFMLAYGIFFCQQFAGYLAQQDGTLSPAKVLEIRNNFGSVQIAMLTLLKTIAGGVDWGEVHSVVAYLGGLNSMVFVSYIVVVWLSLSNIITSIFLEKAMIKTKPEAQTRALDNLKENLASAREMVQLFHMISRNSETITPERIAACLEDVKVAALFETQGVEISDIGTFLDHLVEIEGAQEIHVESFVTGCLSIKGPARSNDLLAVKHKLTLLEKDLRDLFDDGTLRI